MKLEDEPVDLCPDAKDYLAQDVNHGAAVGVDGAHAQGAGSQESIAVLAVLEEANGEAAFRNRSDPGTVTGVTDRQLALGGGPHDRVHLALDDAIGVHL